MPEELKFYCDGDGIHLICIPYTVANLHVMAEVVGIKRCWFHNSKDHPHYDIPKRRIEEFKHREDVQLVSSRDIIKIIRGEFKQ